MIQEGSLAGWGGPVVRAGFLAGDRGLSRGSSGGGGGGGGAGAGRCPAGRGGGGAGRGGAPLSSTPARQPRPGRASRKRWRGSHVAFVCGAGGPARLRDGRSGDPGAAAAPLPRGLQGARSAAGARAPGGQQRAGLAATGGTRAAAATPGPGRAPGPRVTLTLGRAGKEGRGWAPGVGVVRSVPPPRAPWAAVSPPSSG